MSIDLNSIAILNIDGIDFRCIISGSSNSEVINSLINADLSEKEIKHKFSLSYTKDGYPI